MRTPTLLLVGGDSPFRKLDNAQAMSRALPNAQVVVMPGQQHIAMFTAPDLFVGEIIRFLDDRSR
ncbi:MAG TPA: alpha/beta hydrolase [Anaerolineae bacterium]|nr:alpha/beta hydrolase [Anaerolineae bacterium]